MPTMDKKSNKQTTPSPDQPTNATPPPAGGDAPKPKASGGKMAMIIVLCLLVVGGAVWLARNRAAGAVKKGPGAGRTELPAVPVVAIPVVQKDVPIYLNRSEER